MSFAKIFGIDNCPADSAAALPFFYPAPYLSVGLAIGAVASYLLFKDLEKGSNHLAKGIEKNLVESAKKKHLQVTVISLDIEILLQEEMKKKSSWFPSLSPVNETFKKVFFLSKPKAV